MQQQDSPWGVSIRSASPRAFPPPNHAAAKVTAARTAAATSPTPMSPSPCGDSAPPAQLSHPVLVVDDENAIRTVVKRSLARDHWTVEEAADGQSALALLLDPTRDWAAVVLDLTLPGLGGFDIYRRLLAERPHIAARVAFTSGAPSAQAEGSGRPVLAKPFELGELRELVRRLAAGRLEA